MPVSVPQDTVVLGEGVLERWAGLERRPSMSERAVWSSEQVLFGAALHGRPDLPPVSIKSARCAIPTFQIIVTWSSLHHLCNPILDIPVQTLPKLHHNGQAISVSSFVH